MKSISADSFKVLRPLGAALVVLVLLNIGLYSILSPAQQVAVADLPRSIRFDFDGDAPNKSWYSSEKISDGTTFEWTSAVDAPLSFTLLVRDPLEVVFRVINNEANLIDGPQLSANGKPIVLTHTGDQFSGLIPLDVINTHPASLDLNFHTAKVFRPAEINPGNTDTRTLGAAFDWLILRPHADNSTLYEFDQGCIETNGWSGTEIDSANGSNFCWTSALDATLPIRIPRGKPFTLEAGVNTAILPEVLKTFRLKINDTLLQTHEEAHTGTFIYTVDVPAMDAETAVVTFHVDQILTSGNGDQRLLGVRVDWLRVTEKPS